jgi:hypothetical protein
VPEQSNNSSGLYSFTGAGSRNTASEDYSFVGAGDDNTSSGNYSFVGAGLDNDAIGECAFLGAGTSNTASGFFSFTGAGFDNTASGSRSFVGSGSTNTASGDYSFVGGGESNTASGDYSFVGGGEGNTAQSYGESVFGIFAKVGTGTQDSRVDEDRLFVVGNGTGTDPADRSNALTILKNGNTTINGGLQVGFKEYGDDGDMSGLTTYSIIKYTYDGAVTALPTATAYTGKILYIINASGDTRTINTETVGDDEVIQLISDGSSWYTVSVSP